MDLDTAVAVLKQDLKDHPEKLELERNVLEKYGKLFRYENIDNITADQFGDFCDVKNNRHWTISRHKTNLTKDMDKLKKSLKILLDESIPIANRLKRLRDEKNPDYQKYLGEAYFSPILLVAHPKKYPVYNGTVKDALDKMHVAKLTSRDIWERYPEVQKIILNIAQKHNLTLWQMDWVWWKALGAKSYEELLTYIRDEMVMQENYQPIVLRKILLSGSTSREEIEAELKKNNPDSESKSMTDTVLKVLQDEKHPIIRKEDDLYVINSFDELSSEKTKELVNRCNKRIEKFEGKNKILKKALYVSNNFPEMLNEFQKIVEKKGKAYYAIGNWKPANLLTPDFPLLLYLQSKGKVVAIFTVSKILNFDEFDKIENKMSYRVTQKPGDADSSTSAFLELTQTSILDNPFPIGELTQFNNGKKVDYFPQRVAYVVDIGIPNIIQQRDNVWIWSVTQENWEILKQKNIWASRIGQNIRDKIVSGDKVIFYVQGTGQFKGIFEFDGDWYDASEPVWADETDSVIYQSQIRLTPIVFGGVVVYDIASELSMFKNPDDKRLVNLVLKGAGGYPSNNGKPIPLEDYNKIYQKMSSEINYWKISPGPIGEDWENQLNNGEIGIHFLDFGDLSTFTEAEIQHQIKIAYGESEVAKRANTFGQMRDFMKIKEGDIIVANSGKSKVLGVGRVAGPYRYKKNAKYPHVFPVDWFDKNESTIPKQEGWMVTVIPLTKEDFESLTKHRTKYFLFRYVHEEGEKENESGDILGKRYHFSNNVQNYTKLVQGAKTVWFDTDRGDYSFWGYGDISKIEINSDGHHFAYYDKFSFFNPPSNDSESTDSILPKVGDQSIREKIRNIPNFNNQFSILPITKEVYDEIVNGDSGLQKLSEKTFDDEQIPSEKTFDDVQIPLLSLNDIKNGLEKIKSELLIPDKKITEILNALSSGSHVILAGPIGTGKTELARKIPELFWNEYGGYYSNIYTATADWNTQDVIGGIVPKMKEGKVIYKIQDGCVTESVKKNWHGDLRRSYTVDGHNYRGVWAIIDEFNRADIDKAFGQLFTALRTRQMKVPSDLHDSAYELVKIPKDFRIIGTLNTADKHYLFPLSNALKSRFAFIEIDLPELKDRDEEIYYALKRSIDFLGDTFSQLLVFDENNKKLDEKTEQKLYSTIYQAYTFLAFVRLYKKLGTAILKTIFQNLLVAAKSKQKLNDALDNALNSTIIPQLEGLSGIEIDAIRAMSSEDILDFFKDINKSNKRHTSGNVFRKTMEFLQVDPIDDETFTQKQLSENDNLWDEIKKTFSKMQGSVQHSMPTELEQVDKSLTSLIEQSII